MVIKDLYEKFINICDILNKTTNGHITVSNGVYTWIEENSLHIITFSEKLEKDIIPFLINKYQLNPSIFMFMSKYFTIEDIKFNDENITFIYSNTFSEEALGDKLILHMFPLIERTVKEKYIIKIDYILNTDEKYQKIYSILENIDINVDFDNTTIITNFKPEDIVNNIRPIEIEQDGYVLRVAKSLFCSVHKNDLLTLECIPYKNNNDIYLLRATASKKEYIIINLYNVLKI